MRYVYLLAVLLLAPATVLAQSALFTPDASARAVLTAQQAEVLAHVEAFEAFVATEIGRVQPEALAEDGAVRLALPGGTVTLAAERVTVRAAADRSWYGTGDSEGTSGQFVARDDVIVGTVHHAGELYTLRSLGDGLHALVHLDGAALPPQHGDLELRDPTQATRKAANEHAKAYEAPSSASSGAVTIDILIAYTNAARMTAGGTSAIEALAQLAVDETNTTYSNSGIAHRFALVHTTNTPTNEMGIEYDLSDVTFDWDGRFEDVHPLRDQYGADMVSLMGDYGGLCGNGWTSSPASENFAFSVINFACVGVSYPLAHETGHNLGATHGPNPNNPFYAYGNGYYYEPGGWRTVMVNPPNGTRIPYWSNPDVLYGGVPMGTVQHHDNARVLNDNAPIIAEYRDSVTGCQQSLSATLDNDAPVPGETITFAATVSNDAASAAPVDLWLDVTGPPDARLRLGSGTLPASAAATVNVPFRVPSNAPAGSYTLDLHLGDFAAAEPCGTETFAVTVAPARLAGDPSDTEFTASVEGALFAASPARARTATPAAVSAMTVGPNPVRSRTTIRYQVEAPAQVRLAVYDLLGRMVAVLEDGHVEAGSHAATFDADALPSGTYLVRLTTGGAVHTKRLTVLR